MKMNRWPLGQVGPGGGQEGPWGRIYVTMTLMSWLRGPVEGRARKDQGGHGAYGARKEGMRRQVGNRGESKDRCGSPPRHTPPPLAESDHDSHAWALGSNPESPMALVGTT